MTLPVWLDSGFILTALGMVGGCGSYMLIFFLKSRCHTVQCGCIRCERTPLEPSDMHRVNIASAPAQDYTVEEID
tara:strand:- start:178 stop:402 length:225 start_codon:yes stop_codon:yes gene_type:complete